MLDAKKLNAHIQRLPELRKRVKELEDRLVRLEGKAGEAQKA
jgi:hypothetical protein